jgi:cytoskeletal protein RodZ
MERIGERLRRRREELGLTLEDVSESIRYRPEIISAIEEGRTSVFPAKAYLSAFLRAYAVILELDPREIVREQKSEEERAFEAIRNIRMKPKRRHKIPRKALYIVVPIVLAAALLVVVDRFLWDREPEVPGEPLRPPVTAVQPGTAAVEDTLAAGAGDNRTGVNSEADGPGEEAEETPSPPPASPPEDTPAETGADDPEASGRGSPPEAALVPLASDADSDEAHEAEAAGTDDPPQTLDSPPVADSSATRPEEQAEPETPAEPRLHKLVVSARRGAYLSLSTGGRSVQKGYFRGGDVDSFFSETPFVIVELSDRGAWSFVQDGERVRLPGSSSEDVSNYEIPLPSGD